MEYQEKKLQLFKLAAMATLKEKSPADDGFSEVLWDNFQRLEAEYQVINEKLKKRDAERSGAMPSKAVVAD